MTCGPGLPPESTALSVGSTATNFRQDRRGLSASAQPISVPPVPMPETMKSTSPPVSAQISSAVVRRWIAGLAGLPNCQGITEFGISLSNLCAASMAPCTRCFLGVNTVSAPSKANILRRSIDSDSGIVRMQR